MGDLRQPAVAFTSPPAPSSSSAAAAITAALDGLEALLALRQDVVLTLERRAAGPSDARPDAEVALLAASAARLAGDIARLIAQLEALLPPAGA